MIKLIKLTNECSNQGQQGSNHNHHDFSPKGCSTVFGDIVGSPEILELEQGLDGVIRDHTYKA